jgi:hypothetical protein
MSKAVMQQALDALEKLIGMGDSEEAIKALRTELAKPEPEPVGSIHAAHLRECVVPFCKEVLFYSPDNIGDFPENRMMLYRREDVLK